MRRSRRASSPLLNRLVMTAKKPETEIAIPACPSVIESSSAIGVSRLTGMNSEATSTNVIRVMQTTVPQGLAASAIRISAVVSMYFLPEVATGAHRRADPAAGAFGLIDGSCADHIDLSHSRD